MASSRSQRALQQGVLLLWRALLLAVLAVYGQLAAADAARGQWVRVAQVVDGDSIVLGDRRHVRLIGINAPELGKRGSAEQPLARAARQYLRELLADRRVRLEIGPQAQDRYGRTLAHLWLPDGRNVQALLVARGLAAMVAIPPNIEQLERLHAAERGARASGLGIWGLAYYRAVPAERLRADTRGFRFVRGRIRQIRRSRKYLYLELSAAFSVMVRRADWAYFQGRPEDLVGREITVRGWVTRRRAGLRIRAGHPAMLGLVY